MSAESLVFGPDEDGESVVIYIEDGSVQNVVLQNADEQQIPYRDLTKEHWTKMSEAEDRALDQLQREIEVDGMNGRDETAVEEVPDARAAVSAVEPA